MNDVAKAAGVAQSTISKALRDDPSIPRQRCAELKLVAGKLGYRPHPLVAALMAQLHGSRRHNDPDLIAWVDLWPADQAPIAIVPALLEGARRRADELGYKIEVHRPTADHISPERLRQILLARTQWGVIIPPVPESLMHYPIDIRGLAGVTIGTSLQFPILHRIAPNHYQGVRLACARLRAKGFRRIGIALTAPYHERVDRKWLAGFVAEQCDWPRRERIPPLILDDVPQAGFDHWLRRHAPEVVLLAEPEIFSWLQRHGTITAAWLDNRGRRKAPGIDYQGERIGAAAVELAVGQIYHNERGSPSIPQTVLLDSVWLDG